MIQVLRFNFLFIVFVMITFSSVGQDILYLRKGGERRIIFDAEDANSLTYRDYDDPDFKLITERKKLYSKVVLANGKTVWLTQRDNYFRCRLGMNIGVVTPLGDFASKDANNSNAGFMTSGVHFSATLDVNMYKFIGLRAMVYGTDEGVGSGHIDYWSDWGFAIGPELHLKLSPRFYASIPILFQYKKMEIGYSFSSFATIPFGPTTFSYTYHGFNSGDGIGFITGLGLHARLGQHLAIGLTSQYFGQTMTLNFEAEDKSTYDNSPAINYGGTYNWNYLTTALVFTIHF